MSAFWQQFLSGLAATSALEYLAVVLAIAYLLLAAWENIWCWACALLSTAIYTYLYADVALISEAFLNVFYMLMAVYGWFHWRHGGPRKSTLPISSWAVKQHLLWIVCAAVSVPVLGFITKNYFAASNAYMDAFTTCFAVIATVMQARKVLENWLYWIVIDAISVYLFVSRGLALTSVLFAIYTIGSIIAYLRWLRRFHTTASACHSY